MKRKTLAMALSAFMILSLAACGGSKTETTAAASSEAAATAAADTGAAPASEGEIKIGLTVPLSGDRATEGSYAQNAVKLVEEEINAAGGVLGKNIKIEIQDSLGTDVGATNAFLKLAADPDIVAIIGSDNSNDNIAIAQSVEQSKIVTTTQGSSPTLQATCEASEWMFQLRACDSTLCTALMDYAVKETGAKTFTIIHDTETASTDQANLFKAGIEANGGSVDDMIAFTSGTKDFTAQITNASAKDSDAIVIACLQTEAAIITQQMKAMGVEKPIFGSNAFGDTVTIGLAGDAMNGAYSVTAWVPDAPTELGGPFSKKYHDTYNEDCAKAAAQIRDHVYVICRAIEDAGSTDRTEIRDAMLKITDYEGAITHYDCSRKGNCGKGGLIVQIQDQVPTIIKEIVTE